MAVDKGRNPALPFPLRNRLRPPPLLNATVGSPVQGISLAGWWKGYAGVTDAGAGAVSAWADQSGHARNLLQTTAGSRGITGTRSLNSLNEIDLDGTNDYLTVNLDTPGIGGNTGTWFAVVTYDAAAGAGFDRIFSFTAAAGIGGAGDYSTTTGITMCRVGALDQFAIFYNDPTATAPKVIQVLPGAGSYLLTFQRDGDTLSSWLNASNLVTVSGVGTAAFDFDLLNIGISSDFVNGAFNGAVGELLWSTDALGTTDRTAIETYLTNTWFASSAPISDSDSATADDSGESISATLTDTESGAIADAGESIAVTITDSDSGTAVDAEVSIALSDADTATLNDAGESIAASLTDTESGAGVDAGEAISATLTDDNSATGTDAGESIAAAVADTDSATGIEDGSVVQPFTDGDTATATDAGEALAAALTDPDTSTASDAGESLAASLTDTDTATGADSTGAVAAALSDTDTASLTDAGESLAVSLSDTDSASLVDAGESLSVNITDSDSATIVDAGENVQQIGTSPTDFDTATASDAGESIIVAVSDSDSATIDDAGESISIPTEPVVAPVQQGGSGPNFGRGPTYPDRTPEQVLREEEEIMVIF